MCLGISSDCTEKSFHQPSYRNNIYSVPSFWPKQTIRMKNGSPSFPTGSVLPTNVRQDLAFSSNPIHSTSLSEGKGCSPSLSTKLPERTNSTRLCLEQRGLVMLEDTMVLQILIWVQLEFGGPQRWNLLPCQSGYRSAASLVPGGMEILCEAVVHPIRGNSRSSSNRLCNPSNAHIVTAVLKSGHLP